MGRTRSTIKRQKEYCGSTMLVLIRRYYCMTALTSQAAVMQASTELCGRGCSWTVPPKLSSGRVGNALMQLNDSSIVRGVRECQILIHDALLIEDGYIPFRRQEKSPSNNCQYHFKSWRLVKLLH